MDNEKINQLKDYMRTAKISFSYKKLNGEIRNAVGTLDMSYIDEYNSRPLNTAKKYIKGLFKYFDVDKNEWRSCREDNIIDFKSPDAISLELF